MSGALALVACSEGAVSEARADRREPLDCEKTKNYTAALGEATIRCLGTFGPDTYRVNDAGMLVPSFASCSRPGAGDAFRDIEDLLSIQVLSEDPSVRTCIAGAYLDWASRFRAEGNRACPTWNVVASRGEPTEAAVRDVMKRFDFDAMLAGTAERSAVLAAMHHDFVYDVAFTGQTADQPCGDALACATSCATAFPGWHIGTEEGRFVGDPTWWVGDNYAIGANPFMVPGFYHPMSFEQPAPGAIFGHRNRVGEMCSKYVTATIHYKLKLVRYCVDEATQTGCMSKCAPVTACNYAGCQR